MPQMVRDIVREAAGEQGARVVGEVAGSEATVAAIRSTRPDLVVCGSSASKVVYSELIAAPARVRVLLMRDDGRDGTLCTLRPNSVSLKEVSPRDLADLIRAGD